MSTTTTTTTVATTTAAAIGVVATGNEASSGSPDTGLFEHGTPEDPSVALAAYRRASSAIGDGVLRFYVEPNPNNLDLLTRAVREISLEPRASYAPERIDAVLRAEDRSFEQTLIAHERELAPTLRQLRDRYPSRLRLVLSTGNRPYMLPPPALDISTNDLCGLECNMCGNRASKRDPHTMLPEHVRALIQEAADWGIGRVALTGAGEPFRDPQMLEHIRYANSLGLLVTITTNGFPISEKVAETLAASTVSISVSIHGATDAMHDAIVGVPKASENAWRAIRRMVKARSKANASFSPSPSSSSSSSSSKLSINVSTVIQRQNFIEIPALVRRARDEGCNGVNIQPVNLQHGSFRNATSAGGEDMSTSTIIRRDDLVLMSRLWPMQDQRRSLEAMFDELDALKSELGSFMHASAERLALFRRYFRDSSRDALRVACRVGEAFLAIDHRGQIKPCYRLPWSHGDARLKSVRALWNSQAYAQTRQHIDACPLTCMNNCFFREKRVSS